MEKSARSISLRKWSRLAARRQHALLAELVAWAQAAPEAHGPEFRRRYGELTEAAELDRFAIPPWLAPHEALNELLRFHQALAGTEATPETEDHPLSWQPTFAVEVVLDQVRSAFNVGSVLRLIDNFGFSGLVHATAGLRLDHPRLVRAARGAQRWIPCRLETDLAAYLTASDVPVIGLECAERARDIRDWQPPPACRLLLGNESYGIAAALRERCDELVYIPMHGYKRSMNVHHALAVVAQKIVEHQGRLL
ncbi:SpoU-methylase domain-containing protein [Sulfidibacter corallicola]|uniref:tRNA/rRNA methyltransferase SpoU type domain-containing protein n=1 Tax=Sulfidibacter corallicola TaxID=2818388 RepID=A0A8A4TFE2_SULCO|nr:TrmH family RNA methyltransferase [Sulfidibacter corallicola]QTD47922.1 hypothetical protein J3U87_20240 [Sulfidibacter corallicola]